MKKIIALEEHFLPSGFSFPPEIARVLDPEFRTAHIAPRMTDLERYRLPIMDQYGIDMQVLSLPPGIQMIPETQQAIRKAKKGNDILAEISRKYPTRFSGFAALPLQDPTAAADELERAVKQLGLKGAMINGHTHGQMIDEQQFWPVWERAEALGVPIYIHPGTIPPSQKNGLYEDCTVLHGPVWNWGVEVGSYTLRLIFAGVFDHFPNIILILGHLGEMLPYLLWRLDSRAQISSGVQRNKYPPSYYIRKNVMVTTSGQFAPEPLLCSLLTLGADHILFAIDYPFEETEKGIAFIETAPISEIDKEKICHKNAEHLLTLDH